MEMIHCKALNRNFSTKADLFAALKANKGDIMAFKKATVKFSDPVHWAISGKTGQANKGLTPSGPISYGDKVYPVINTTLYLDSHDDVHINGLWDKSAAEQRGKTYLIVNHQLEVGKVVSQPKDVDIIIEEMSWKDLGASYEGETQALIFGAKLTERSNKDGFEAYKNNDPVQHSIRMQYVRLEMAINEPNDKDYAEQYAVWQKYYPMIANKERADENGYFFAVLEAKIYKEGSMVLSGSNDITPTLYDFESAAGSKATAPRSTGPSKDTRLMEAIAALETKISV